jgi:hypothetical protein
MSMSSRSGLHKRPGSGRFFRPPRSALVLDSCGANRLAVAAVIKSRLETTSQDALRIAAVGAATLLRRSAPRVWELDRLQQEIVSAGDSTHIERIEQ